MRIYSPYQEKPEASPKCNMKVLDLLKRRDFLLSPTAKSRESKGGPSMTNSRVRRSLLVTLPSCLGMVFVSLVVLSNTLAWTGSVENRTVAEMGDHRHPFARPVQRPQLEQQRRGLFARIWRGATSSIEPRIIVFGTSSTYGVGLSEGAMKRIYPYQLSRTAHNAATASGGFTLPAACTQSIVRDNIYDIIVLEFQVWEPAVSILARRLRTRFPKAFMIFLRLWHPSQLRYKQTNGTDIDFHAYRKTVHPGKAMDDPELYLSVLATKDRWSFAKSNDETFVTDDALRLGAYYFTLNFPDTDLFEFPKTMMDALSIYQDGSDNLNEQGHTIVAGTLRSIFAANKNALAYDTDQPQLGSWGSGDECQLWYENGIFPTSAQEKKALRKVEFAHANHGGGNEWFVGTDHKHALEVDNRAGGMLRVNNPFHTTRMLYLTYLTSFGDSDEKSAQSDADQKEFSQLRIRINEKPAILIQAWHTRHTAVGHELARTSAVGLVPPGESVLHLDPLVRAHKFTRAFKLLGWCILASDVEEQGLQLEFSLEQAPILPPPAGSKTWTWFS